MAKRTNTACYCSYGTEQSVVIPAPRKCIRGKITIRNYFRGKCAVILFTGTWFEKVATASSQQLEVAHKEKFVAAANLRCDDELWKEKFAKLSVFACSIYTRPCIVRREQSRRCHDDNDVSEKFWQKVDKFWEARIHPCLNFSYGWNGGAKMFAQLWGEYLTQWQNVWISRPCSATSSLGFPFMFIFRGKITIKHANESFFKKLSEENSKSQLEVEG